MSCSNNCSSPLSHPQPRETHQVHCPRSSWSCYQGAAVTPGRGTLLVPCGHVEVCAPSLSPTPQACSLTHPTPRRLQAPSRAARLLITGASFGLADQPRAMYDVTEEVQGKVDAYAAATTVPHHGSGDSKSSYLEIRPSEDVTAWLGDPAPGQDKWLQLHYYVLPQGSSVTFTARYQHTRTPTVGDWYYLTHHAPCTMHTHEQERHPHAASDAGGAHH